MPCYLFTIEEMQGIFPGGQIHKSEVVLEEVALTSIYVPGHSDTHSLPLSGCVSAIVLRIVLCLWVITNFTEDIKQRHSSLYKINRPRVQVFNCRAAWLRRGLYPGRWHDP